MSHVESSIDETLTQSCTVGHCSAVGAARQTPQLRASAAGHTYSMYRYRENRHAGSVQLNVERDSEKSHEDRLHE